MIGWPVVMLVVVVAFAVGVCVGLADALWVLRRERRRVTVELWSPEARRALSALTEDAVRRREPRSSNVVRIR